MNWKQLQNGSDIRGVAIEGVEGESVNLTPETTEILGKSFVAWLSRKYRDDIQVAVGMDSRISGPILKDAFSSGVLSMGADVLDCGLASTPAMFMVTREPVSVTAGVMLTASHLPFNRNGLKFFTSGGGLDKKDISEILDIAEKDEFEAGNKTGKRQFRNYIRDYSETLVNYIREKVKDKNDYNRPLKGLKIIVDAGNGAGGFFADMVLGPLGADTRGSQFLDPDGTFPNHVPNPENDEAMASICKAVIREKADLGIIFDTDVDRAAVVSKFGEPINRNELIALISSVVLREFPNSTIVTDSITSEGLTDFIENKLKGSHHRFKRGYKNVINEAIRLNKEGTECYLAIETSGHAALKENYFLDDGAFLVAKLLVELARLHARKIDFTSVLADLSKPVESREYRLAVREGDFASYGQWLLKDLTEKIGEVQGWQIVEPNYEGLRVRCTGEDEKGWFLLRLSLHDPVMPLNIESDVEGGVDRIKEVLYEILQVYKELEF